MQISLSFKNVHMMWRIILCIVLITTFVAVMALSARKVMQRLGVTEVAMVQENLSH